MNFHHKLTALFTICFLLFTFASIAVPTQYASAALDCNNANNLTKKNYPGRCCGAPPNSIKTSLDFGCRGIGNPVADIIFSIVRVLTLGVGFVLVLSLIIAGVQYSTSGGNPQAVSKAKSRIMSTAIALFVFLFAYALLNYVVPGGLLT